METKRKTTSESEYSLNSCTSGTAPISERQEVNTTSPKVIEDGQDEDDKQNIVVQEDTTNTVYEAPKKVKIKRNVTFPNHDTIALFS